MSRHLVEFPPFKRHIDSLGAGGPVILKEIQEALLGDPEAEDLIQGTGGLRKMRHRAAGRGKRGGYRVTYLYVPLRETIYLIVLYAKNEKENLSKAERNELRKMIELLKQEKAK